MNTTYWLAVFVLQMIAFFIVIPPIWKIRKIKPADFNQENINIAQERVKDLNKQLGSGVLTKEQFKEQYEELELSLNDDLSIEQKVEKKSSQGRWIVPVILLLVPLSSFSTYFILGEPDALIKAQSQSTQQARSTVENVNAMVSGLVERLKQDPENADDWLMLGRSYKFLKKYKLAVNAFGKAYDLLGDQPEVMLYYANSLAMASDGTFSNKAAELVFNALELSPDNKTGLWLAGMVKVEQKEMTQAMKYWLKLETLLPPDSTSYRQLQTLMSSIRAQNPDLLPAPDKMTVDSLASINVQVSIDDSIKNKTGSKDTVFIYAKALSGSPMPLAIVRKQVADLPVSVTLDDSMAMMPAMKLSNFEQVKVMARISKSGTAMQQKGDFIGTVELSNLSEKPSIVIVINKEI